MKKILIRAGMSPFDNHSPSDVLLKDSIGANSGNLLYQYSIFRQFSSDSTELIPNYFSNSSLNIEKINAEYSACIMPFANSFRSSYRNGLKSYTKLIKQLDIPVVVIGIGLQAPLGANINSKFSFDREVKEFVEAVLEKSSMLGLRGQITADYLSRLGFEAEKDFTVTGCPSMYAFGDDLKISKPNLSKKSSIYINSSPKAPKNIVDFLQNIMSAYPNHTFVPQDIREMELIYTGTLADKEMEKLDANFLSAYERNQVEYFINIKSWLERLSRADLTVGARMHGNIASILSGTPSIIFPIDTRTQELSEYHGLPSLSVDKITSSMTLHDIVEIIDWDAVLNNHSRNYQHYLSFLEKNGIKNLLNTSSNFESSISKLYTPGPITTLDTIDESEKLERLQSYYPAKINHLSTDLGDVKKDVKELKRKIKHITKQKGTLSIVKEVVKKVLK